MSNDANEPKPLPAPVVSSSLPGRDNESDLDLLSAFTPEERRHILAGGIRQAFVCSTVFAVVGLVYWIGMSVAGRIPTLPDWYGDMLLLPYAIVFYGHIRDNLLKLLK